MRNGSIELFLLLLRMLLFFLLLVMVFALLSDMDGIYSFNLVNFDSV